MRYSNGSAVRVGDRVQLWEGNYGTVVCSIDTNEFTAKFPREEWEHIARGVVIETEKHGVFHYEESDEDFELIERNPAG